MSIYRYAFNAADLSFKLHDKSIKQINKVFIELINTNYKV